MRTLILTCNTGEGHNSTAAAICEVFIQNGEFCEMRESLQFASIRFSKIIGKGHVGIYRHYPKLFNKGYSMSEKHDSYFAEGSLLYKILTRGTKKLYDYIVENSIDNIICVHPFAALLVSKLRKEYDISISTSLVATDYTCAPSTNCSTMDRYFIPHELLKDEFEKCGIPRDKLFASGIPVKQSFFGINNKENSRMILGLPQDKKILVMCCGSMGCGPMKKVASKICELSDDNTLTIVICGSNKKLYNSLQPQQTKKFFVIGYTKQMCEYMQACDVFVTKPGGISTTEAAVLGKPMVFINAVAGCELRNKLFFEKTNCAVTVCSNDDVPNAALQLLDNIDSCNGFTDRIKKTIRRNGAVYIYDYLENSKEATV